MNFQDQIKQLTSAMTDPRLAPLAEMSVRISSYAGNEIQIRAIANELSEEQYRILKSIFGPFSFNDNADHKDAKGHILHIRNGVEMKIGLTVWYVMKCEVVEINQDTGPTEEQTERIIELIRSGEIKVTDCTTGEFQEACATKGCISPNTIGENLCGDCFAKAQDEHVQRHEEDTPTRDENNLPPKNEGDDDVPW